MFALFENGEIQEAENLIRETEKHDDNFNHRLEGFLIEVEKFTRHSLISVGESEDKVIFIMAATTSISLLLMVFILLYVGISTFWGRFMSRDIRVHDKSV